MLYLSMAFSVLLIILFGYLFYLDRQIAGLKKKIEARQAASTENTSSKS